MVYSYLYLCNKWLYIAFALVGGNEGSLESIVVYDPPDRGFGIVLIISFFILEVQGM